MKQSLAIAYSMKKKAKKMADGGTTVVDKDTYNKNMAGSGWTPGETPEEAHKRKLEAIKKSQEYQGPQGLADGGMVDRVMKKRMYSEGGRVANEEEVHADEMPNEFDDLVLDDHLEPHFEEGGNEHGDEQEAHDRSDIIARIMKSRAKKDRNPRPA